MQSLLQGVKMKNSREHSICQSQKPNIYLQQEKKKKEEEYGEVAPRKSCMNARRQNPQIPPDKTETCPKLSDWKWKSGLRQGVDSLSLLDLVVLSRMGRKMGRKGSPHGQPGREGSTPGMVPS